MPTFATIAHDATAHLGMRAPVPFAVGGRQRLGVLAVRAAGGLRAVDWRLGRFFDHADIFNISGRWEARRKCTLGRISRCRFRPDVVRNGLRRAECPQTRRRTEGAIALPKASFAICRPVGARGRPGRSAFSRPTATTLRRRDGQVGTCSRGSRPWDGQRAGRQ